MADRQKIYAELTKIMRGVFDDDALTPTDATTANDVEEWDSINHIQLIVAVEKKFQIRFKVDEITSFKNVGEFVSSIEKKITPQ